MKYIGQTNQLIIDFLNKSVTVNRLKNNELTFVKLNDNKKVKELLSFIISTYNERRSTKH